MIEVIYKNHCRMTLIFFVSVISFASLRITLLFPRDGHGDKSNAA